jgi:prepilin-type N-terminal cleavage/methylation domain-containing protein
MARTDGLTLLEVLVSLAILTLIATTTLPLLRESSAVLADREPSSTVADSLPELADSVMKDPRVFSFVDGLPEQGEVTWHDQPDWPPVVFRKMQDATEHDHGWVLFECGGFSVWRWYALDGAPTEKPRKP